MVWATSHLELNNMRRCIFLFSLVMERTLKGEKTLGRKVSVNGGSVRSPVAEASGKKMELQFSLLRMVIDDEKVIRNFFQFWNRHSSGGCQEQVSSPFCHLPNQTTPAGRGPRWRRGTAPARLIIRYTIQIISAIFPARLIRVYCGKLSCRRSKADKQGADPRRIFQSKNDFSTKFVLSCLSKENLATKAEPLRDRTRDRTPQNHY